MGFGFTVRVVARSRSPTHLFGSYGHVREPLQQSAGLRYLRSAAFLHLYCCGVVPLATHTFRCSAPLPSVGISVASCDVHRWCIHSLDSPVLLPDGHHMAGTVNYCERRSCLSSAETQAPGKGERAIVASQPASAALVFSGLEMTRSIRAYR